MEFSHSQEEAISCVLDWHQGSDPIFRLFGYAGAGKTTIAREIADRVGGKVMYAAMTGKAALVLNSKGCYGARTIHSLVYIPRDKCESALLTIKQEMDKTTDEDRLRELLQSYYAERENLKRPAFNLNKDSELKDASLLILDEVSMVNQFIAEDLLSFGVPILALGDPAQLPPVKGNGYFTNAEPDYLLTEIHRQAQESPIINMATHVRQGNSLSYGGPQEAQVVPKGTYDAKGLASFDQVICGRNRTRRLINDHIREQVLEFTSPLPNIGDRIVCLRNDNRSGLLNGSQWDVNGVEDLDDDRLRLTIAASGDQESYSFDVEAHKQFFLGTEDEIPHYEIKEAQCFDYAYALTCHKAQGSQWNRVAIINESGCFRQDASRWLYTAITRAAEELAVIQ
jgi:exodeoxyribonuclease-5